MSNTTAVIERLQGDRQASVDFIEQTLEAVQTEGRDLSETEERSLSTHRDRMSKLDEQLKPLVEFETVRRSAVEIDRRLTAPVSARTSPRPAYPSGAEFRGFGDLYVASEGYQSRGWQGRLQLDDVDALQLATETRAVLTTGATPGKDYLPTPYRFTTSIPEFRTPLLDAVTKVAVTTGSVDVLTWGEITGTAEVAEGSVKPEVSVVNGSAPLSLKTIAGWVKYTRQLAEDAAGFAAFLNAGITRDLLRKLQANMAAAITAASIPSTTGAAGKPLIEVIRAGMAKVEEAGFQPSVVIASPTTLAALDVSVLNLGGSSSTVLAGGQWGLTPVPVSGYANVIVADAAEAFVFFTRTGINIYTTDSDISGAGSTAASDFRSNILTTLGETRGQGAVQNPNAATKCVTTP
jgi:HK97 family phage major capsid protein